MPNPPPEQLPPPDITPGGFRQPPAPAARTSQSPVLPAVNPPLAANPVLGKPPRRERRRLPLLLLVALVGFGALGGVTSWLALPRIEDHLTAEATARLEEAGIRGATVELNGRTATISGLAGEDAERAETLLDAEWGIRDAKLSDTKFSDTKFSDEETDTSAETPAAAEPSTTTEAAPATVAPPASSTQPPATTTAPATTTTAVPNLDAELATLEAQFNASSPFAPGSAALTANGQAVLREVADLLSTFPEALLRIEGHTDNEGTEIANLLLSQARADAAATELGTLGIDPTRLIALGLGENEPVADNGTAAGRASNRRTEFSAS